jgi:hypothetical protein
MSDIEEWRAAQVVDFEVYDDGAGSVCAELSILRDDSMGSV